MTNERYKAMRWNTLYSYMHEGMFKHLVQTLSRAADGYGIKLPTHVAAANLIVVWD